jgi:hypothetical protein
MLSCLNVILGQHDVWSQDSTGVVGLCMEDMGSNTESSCEYRCIE